MCQQPVGTLRPDRSEEDHSVTAVPSVTTEPPVSQYVGQSGSWSDSQAARIESSTLRREAQSAHITTNHPRPTAAAVPSTAVVLPEEILEPSSAAEIAAAAAVAAAGAAVGVRLVAARAGVLLGTTADEVARVEVAAAAAREAVAAAVREVEIQGRSPRADDRNHWHAAGHNSQRLWSRPAAPLVVPLAAPRPGQHLGTGSVSVGERQHVSSNVVPGRAPSVRNNIIPGVSNRKKFSAAAREPRQPLRAGDTNMNAPGQGDRHVEHTQRFQEFMRWFGDPKASDQFFVC